MYLLTWNPRRWPWDSLDEDMETLRAKGYLEKRWSCGTSQRIEEGARVFLMRLGMEPKGLVAIGRVTKAPHEALHWDPERAALNEAMLAVTVAFEHIERDPVITLQELEDAFADSNWTPQASGIRIDPAVGERVEALWVERLGGNPRVDAEEIPEGLALIEGGVRRVLRTVRERNAEARHICIKKYGSECFVCGFSFSQFYGEFAANAICVHHVVPLGSTDGEYVVDPIRDLRPLCPNCHEAIHRTRPLATPEAMRDQLRARRDGKPRRTSQR